MTEHAPKGTLVRSYSTELRARRGSDLRGRHVAQRPHGRHRLDRLHRRRTAQCFGGRRRMSARRAPRRAGQRSRRPTRSVAGRRLRRPDRRAHGRVGTEPARQGDRLLPATRPTSTSRRSRSACAARSSRTAARGYEVFWRALKTEAATRRSCAGTARSATSRRCSATSAPSTASRTATSSRRPIDRQRPQGLHQRRRGDHAPPTTSTPTARPGVGFNFGVGDTNVDHGLHIFEVDTYDGLSGDRGYIAPTAR